MPQSNTTEQPGGGPVCILRDGVLCSPYNPQDLVAVTMTAEEWASVQSCLQCAADRQRATMLQWRDFCADKKMGAETAARYEYGAVKLERMVKIIEQTIFPPPPPETALQIIEEATYEESETQ